MTVQKTIVCKVRGSDTSQRRLLATLRAFQQACNYVSAIAFHEKCFGKRQLHQRLYYTIRERFALPANYAIRAIARVSQSYQTHRQKVHQFRARSLDLDKRLYTVLRTTDLPEVTIASCAGRVRLCMVLGDYQRTWLQHETRYAKLVYCHRTKTFYQKYPEKITRLIENEVKRLEEDGASHPQWKWGKDELWKQVEQEWTGKCTHELLVTLKYCNLLKIYPTS
ncbi:MAG: hypothetical protein ACXACI_00465 [Candidatus Hodarchaeales archaeon]